MICFDRYKNKTFCWCFSKFQNYSTFFENYSETTICYFCVGSQKKKIPFIRKLQFCQKFFRSLLFKNKNVLTSTCKYQKKNMPTVGFQLFASGFLTAVTPTLVFAQDTNCAATESPRHSQIKRKKKTLTDELKFFLLKNCFST